MVARITPNQYFGLEEPALLEGDNSQLIILGIIGIIVVGIVIGGIAIFNFNYDGFFRFDTYESLDDISNDIIKKLRAEATAIIANLNISAHSEWDYDY